MTPEGLIVDLRHWVPEVPPMDSQLIYDTLFVVWVLGLALYMFHLGRLLGSSVWLNH